MSLSWRTRRQNPFKFAKNPIVAARPANPRRPGRKIGADSHIIKHLVHEGKVKVMYAVYDLDSGKVEFIG